MDADNELRTALWNLIVSIMAAQNPVLYKDPRLEPYVNMSQIEAVVTAVDQRIKEHIGERVNQMMLGLAIDELVKAKVEQSLYRVMVEGPK